MYIAIITSVYSKSSSEEVGEAIRSICNQTFNLKYINFYIYIDGPISDNLAISIQNYNQTHPFNKFTIINATINKGLAFAMNAIIEVLEQEELIFRMDTDDIMYPNRLAKQFAYMAENSEVDICGSFITEFNDTLDASNRHFLKTYPARVSINNFYYSCPIAHPTAVFRRSALQTLGGYNNRPFNEDIDLWFRAMKMNLTIHNIQEPLLYFRISNNFFSRRTLIKARTELSIYLKYLTQLNGFSYKLIFPLLRFIFRLAPSRIVKFAYRSKLLRNRGK